MITHNDKLKNQVDNAIKAADVFASPVQGEGDRRRRWKGCWKMKSLLSNPEFVTIFCHIILDVFAALNVTEKLSRTKLD